MSGRKQIINPSKISKEEQEFVLSSHQPMPEKKKQLSGQKTKYVRVLFSMPESLSNDLSEYLLRNPSEGKKSTFVARILAEYLAHKRREEKRY